jgi:hypothetical protein
VGVFLKAFVRKGLRLEGRECIRTGRAASGGAGIGWVVDGVR